MTLGEERFADIKKLVGYSCTNAPPDVVERAMLDSIRRIARQTGVLQSTFVLPEVQAGVAEYDFSYVIPDGYLVNKIKWVRLCGCKLRLVDKCAPCPVGYTVTNKMCVELHPCPTRIAPGDLEICLCLYPDYDVCELPDELMQEEELIIAGATAVLTSQAKKAWSDRVTASLMGTAFRAGIVRLRGEVDTEFTDDKDANRRTVHGFI